MLRGWGERQAAGLDLDFNCLLGFSSLLACWQGLSAGKRGLCPLPGTTGPFSQEGARGETARSKAASSAYSGHQEMLKVTSFPRCCLSPPAPLGGRQWGGGDSSEATCPVALQGSLPAPPLPRWVVCFLRNAAFPWEQP